MTRTLRLLLTVACVLPSTALAQSVPTPGDALAQRVAKASGSESWAKVSKLGFSWTVAGRSLTRSYAWDVVAGTVTHFPAPDERCELPVGGWAKPGDAPDADHLNAHKGWVNDSFWAMAGLHLAWDAGLTFTDLGEQEVPQLPKLGKRRALSARYGETGGYTPGDLYVFYLDEQDLPVAWAFHKGGAEQPNLVATWEGFVTKAGLTLPSKFVLPSGKTLIEIKDLIVETSDAETTGPASRPASGAGE